MKIRKSPARGFFIGLGILSLFAWSVPSLLAAPLAGGTLDPTVIPKYADPLIIPPAMPRTGKINQKKAKSIDYYEIAVRQFEQQILPGTGFGPAKTDPFPLTTVWSYGNAADPLPGNPAGLPSSFNYPAFTIEAKSNKPVRVKWINDLKDPVTGNHLPHLLTGTADQTLHWANPPQDCADGTTRTDCRGTDPMPYDGPVPIVTHVHGAHVGPESDGYPEAWWLPAANDIPPDFALRGTLFDQFDRTNTEPGTAVFQYPNDQRPTTLWYHDHTLGMTRLNVYAGPAGFWLIRGKGSGLVSGILPEPAPALGDPPGMTYYEIPIVIQDRSFNADGSLFYPDNRAFFEELEPDQLNIDFIPDSDISPIWNPEAFFNTMVVNGRTWPVQNVEPRRYRFRLLNGCNSRFLNLSLFEIITDPVTGVETKGQELPVYQIGAEGGLLPNVVKIETGFNAVLPGGGLPGVRVPATDPAQAVLMAPAERADVIVDFTGLTAGTVIRMLNTAPDAPFGGFPDDPADPGTTGQVMQFVVGPAALPDPSSAPTDLVLSPVAPLVPTAPARKVSLNEEESQEVCVVTDPVTGNVTQITVPPVTGVFGDDCIAAGGEVFAPKAALLGTVDAFGAGVPLLWAEAITENPALNSVEVWEIYNFTEDAHPIHLHLVQFQVVERQSMAMGAMPYAPEPWETGWKDTVIAYPGEITRIRTKFDMEGLYVWHCHIVEHEDNEMMRPYYVGQMPAATGP